VSPSLQLALVWACVIAVLVIGMLVPPDDEP
jgi:hypothetical protein